MGLDHASQVRGDALVAFAPLKGTSVSIVAPSVNLQRFTGGSNSDLLKSISTYS